MKKKYIEFLNMAVVDTSPIIIQIPDNINNRVMTTIAADVIVTIRTGKCNKFFLCSLSGICFTFETIDI